MICWKLRMIRMLVRSLGATWDSWETHRQLREWESQRVAFTAQKNELDQQLDILQNSFAGASKNRPQGPSSRLDDTHLSFLGKLSHELRTMMNGVSGMIALLSDSNLEAEQQDYVLTLERAVESLMTLVNDSLSFSRIETHETPQESTFNLESLLEDAFDFVSNKVGDKPLDVTYDVSPEVPTFLIGDPSYLRTILSNLLSNGIKFTAEGEVYLLVEAKNQTFDSVELHITISDTGIGIPEEDIPRIFEPFSNVSSRTIPKFGGSGLGLAICKKLVLLLQGTVEVKSVPGKGTTFTLDIPFGVDLSTALSPTPAPKELEDVGIFVIDDNERILTRLSRQLKGWGCRVETAENWVEGVKQLKRSAVVMGKPWNLLLLDYRVLVHLFLTKDAWSPWRRSGAADQERQLDHQVHSYCVDGLSSREKRKFCSSRRVASQTGKNTFIPHFQLKQNHLLEVVSRTCGSSPKELIKKSLGTKKTSTSVRLRVLVAEDNPMNQRILQSIVEKLGHFCRITSNGEEALQEFGEHPYDVIFMDCRMPKLDGFEATQKIREREAAEGVLDGIPRHIPIVALTADVMHGTRERCLQVGMDDYLYKPVKKEDIEEILQGLAEKSLASSFSKAESGEFEPTDAASVLLVEDNVVNARIGSVILAKHNCDVHVATHGAMALEMFKEKANQYDIILMDMHMPGMDGIAATEAIREYEREKGYDHVPIIALTADTTEGFRGTCLQAGCSEYMPKPIDYSLLVQLVKKFVADYGKSRHSKHPNDHSS